MGRLRNLISAKVSGNVGAMSFRNRGEETVVAERSYTNKSAGSGATEAQRIHRSRLANIVNFFRIIRAIEARGWENKGAYVSDFNKFTSANLASSPIFLTKQEAAAGASVIYAYRVSRGSLPALTQAYDGTTFRTGVSVGSNFDINQATVAEFSAKIIALNDGWQYGDKLSIAQLKQGYVSVAGLTIPQTNVVYFEVTLDANDTDVMGDKPGASTLQLDVDGSGRMIILDGGDGAFAIHSRETSGQLLTSEQSIIMLNPSNAITVKYSSDAQKQAAMDSYGYTEDVLLTPYSEVEQVIVDPASITSVMLGDSALVDGGSYDEAASLVISGENLSTSNIKVMNGSEVYVPLSNSSSQQTFQLSYSGTYRIYINGNLMYTFTMSIVIPQTVSKVTLGSNNTTNPPLVVSTLTTFVDYALKVEGSGLGELTCTSGSLENAAGDETERTATFSALNDEWTISCGGVVIAHA